MVRQWARNADLVSISLDLDKILKKTYKNRGSPLFRDQEPLFSSTTVLFRVNCLFLIEI